MPWPAPAPWAEKKEAEEADKKLSAELTDKLFVGLLVIILMICAYNAIRMLGAA